MRRKSGVPTGLELSVLEALLALRARGTPESHGFQIAREVADRQGARSLTGHGTLYKALAKMLEQGWLASRWEDPAIAAAEGRPRRRLYEVTAAGAQALAMAPREDAVPAVAWALRPSVG